MLAQRSFEDATRERGRERLGDLGQDAIGEGGVGRDQQGRGVGAVLGLGDEVRGDEPGSAEASARTMPSDGPAGRSVPTSPATSSLAAVTQALPGPTIRSTGSMPASGSP